MAAAILHMQVNPRTHNNRNAIQSWSSLKTFYVKHYLDLTETEFKQKNRCHSNASCVLNKGMEINRLLSDDIWIS